jgi:hypothetical protein
MKRLLPALFGFGVCFFVRETRYFGVNAHPNWSWFFISEKDLRNEGREALAPALSTKIPAPYDSKRTGRAPRPGLLLAFAPVLHS